MFYTYLWLREDGTPYYVGKGSGKRAYDRHAHRVHCPVFRARIFIQYWESEEKAFEMEKWYIAFYGRKDLGTGILQNQTEGGEGPAGYSEERLKRMREVMLGRPSPRKGAKHSEESKKMMSASKLGKKPSEAALKSMSEAQKGRKHTLDTRAKIGKANKKRIYSEATIQKIRASQKVGESGYRGIIWDSQVNKWKVRITIKGRRKYFGHYGLLDDALARLNSVEVGLSSCQEKN